MNSNSKRKIRDGIRLAGAFLFIWLYIPHIFIYAFGTKKQIINSDLIKMRHQIKLGIRLPSWITFLYFLHNNVYYRSLYYYRVGPAFSMLISWWRPGAIDFIIPFSTKIGEGFWFAHPYSTVINAESIGKNFRCIHCTTLGTKEGMKAGGGGRPIIGDNVSIGCHSCIIGPVKIGNNVTIGAGSVVLKDVPDNCIVAGNPARIIKQINYEL